MATIFCTNGLQSKTLAAIRSLGSRGHRVIIGEKEFFHTSRFSKYTQKSVVYPDPQKYPEAFFKWCKEVILSEKIDIFFAMDDDVLEVLVPRQKELNQYCQIPLPPIRSFQIASDKSQTYALAEITDIPHPKTVIPNFDLSVDPQILKELTGHLSFPALIKPKKSSGSRGIRKVRNIEELISVYPLIHELYPNAMIQEEVPSGNKYDVALCYDQHGKIIASYVQREIRNFPIPKGPGTVFESARHQQLLTLTLDLLKNVPWYGVLEVEFLIDPRTNIPMLMEINPRFWASVHNAITAGVDFPYLLYRVAQGEKIQEIPDYKEGVMSRRLLPGDILHFLSNPDRWHLEPSFFTTKIPDDILSWSDPGPTVGFMLSALRNSIRPSMWKFLIQR